MAQKNYSQRKACELVGIAPRVYRYRSKRDDDARSSQEACRIVIRASALWLQALAYSSRARGLARELEKAIESVRSNINRTCCRTMAHVTSLKIWGTGWKTGQGSVRNSVYLAWPCGFTLDHALKRCSRVIANWLLAAKPFSDISASFFKIANGQIDQLGRGLLSWE